MTRRNLLMMILPLLLLWPSTASAQEFAFKDVSVISFEPTQVTYAQTVLISNGRIAEIGSTHDVKIPDGVHVIDGRGKYLMPGMMDSHAHLPGPQGLDMEMKDYLLLQLAHGVTSLRVSRYEPEFKDLAKQIENDEWISPRLFLPLRQFLETNRTTKAARLFRHKTLGFWATCLTK